MFVLGKTIDDLVDDSVPGDSCYRVVFAQRQLTGYLPCMLIVRSDCLNMSSLRPVRAERDVRMTSCVQCAAFRIGKILLLR